jgi:hypothetical protein
METPKKGTRLRFRMQLRVFEFLLVVNANPGYEGWHVMGLGLGFDNDDRLNTGAASCFAPSWPPVAVPRLFSVPATDLLWLAFVAAS